MLTHTAPDAKAAGAGRDHERCVGYVRAKTRLVGSQNVRPNDVSFAFRGVAPIRWMQPVSETLFASNVWIKGIGIATNYDRVKNIPDGGTVSRSRLADLEHLLLRGLTLRLSGGPRSGPSAATGG